MQANYQFNTKLTETNHFSAELIAIIADHEVELISDQLFFLVDSKHQKTIVLEQSVLALIHSLKQFKTIKEHADQVISELGLSPEVSTDIYNVIQKIDEQGFIVRPKQFIDLQGAIQNTVQVRPKVIIRTCNRVAMLKRLLQSAVENESQFVEKYHYIIIDDSFSEQSEANAINIAKSGLDATHFDKAKQQQIIQLLEEKFPDDVTEIQFLLGDSPLHQDEITYGRPWNWGILLSAGKPAVYLDDDCVLKTYKTPFETEQYIDMNRQEKMAAFLDQAYSLDQQLKAEPLDPIARLSSSLGFSVCGMPLREESFHYLSSQYLKNIEEKNILISSQAIAGEPGTDSVRFLFKQEKKNARYFIDVSEQKYQKNKQSRFGWFGYNRPHISFENNDSRVARGIDNRELLPATLPIYRDEDAIFTDLSLCIYQNKAIFDHPWAITHLPESERRWDDKELDKQSSFSMAKGIKYIAAYLNKNTELLTSNPSERLQAFANQLLLISKKDQFEFNQWMYRIQQSSRSADLYTLNNRLKQFLEAPDYYKKDIQRQIIAETAPDQSLNLSEKEQQKYRDILAKYAKSLLIWEALWNFAKITDLENQ